MATTGTLITVYKGFDIRESAQIKPGISLGVNIYRAGEFIGFEKNVALAKSRIDAEVAKEAKAPERVSNDAQSAAPVMTTEARKARNAKRMGRFENNPNDLI